MKEIKNTFLNNSNYGDMINHHIEPLKDQYYKNKGKIIEICHVGKFLLVISNNASILNVREKPDFIIDFDNEIVGLEHQIIVDSIAKEKEGFFQNIFDQAEKKLKTDKNLPNFLANCYVSKNNTFKLRQKPELIDTICQVVKKYVQEDRLIENPIIDRIFSMKHSQISLNPNLGGWWEKSIPKELIIDAIKNKEDKINIYKKNSCQKQWLLLVIGGTGESSYNADKLESFDINSKFDKIYLMEDFAAKVYELK